LILFFACSSHIIFISSVVFVAGSSHQYFFEFGNGFVADLSIRSFFSSGDGYKFISLSPATKKRTKENAAPVAALFPVQRDAA